MPETALNPQQSAAIEAELFAGRKIQAIKLYRDATRVGLAEAKSAVDAIEAQLRQSQPTSFRHAQSGTGGCVTKLLLLLILLAVGGFVVYLMISQK